MFFSCVVNFQSQVTEIYKHSILLAQPSKANMTFDVVIGIFNSMSIAFKMLQSHRGRRQYIWTVNWETQSGRGCEWYSFSYGGEILCPLWAKEKV